jgi:7,8-dihydroneopterin aldolase/epimerase/oxygenase
MSKIALNNMEFHAYHGCLEHEQQLGNTFIVNLCMTLDTELAGQTDELQHTLNYQQVYDLVKLQMEIPSMLIEHVVKRILDSVFDSFFQIEELTVQLFKLNPPLGGKVESVSIELSKKRG